MEQNNKITASSDLTPEEIKRYSRHMVLAEVGEAGQKKLKLARVLIVGAGGLGSPIGLYLAAAGVGTLGIIDFDTVSYSNLQRQVLFSEGDVGKSKSEIAKERLFEINPDVNVKAYNEKLTCENAIDIISNYDVVADGSDNFSAKYLVNDACVLLGKPLVYGSVLKFEGQASVFYAKEGPCYRCLYPEPPEAGSVLSCEEAGVLGVLPGIIGSIQANEVIKLFIGKGEPLTGRLLMLNSLDMKFKEIKFDKDPDCPVCGKHPVIKSLSEELYDFESCAPENAEDGDFKLDITVEELKKKIDNKEKFFLLDVREPIETRISSIGGELIPINDLPNRLNELNKDDEIIVYCRSGHRSQNAVQFLREQAGFKKARNLLGGINLWAEKIDNSLPKY
jgi:molybdopterin/thiamine biosynthesis adenylyltransferase/rhodanese-related sulfurtransferase